MPVDRGRAAQRPAHVRPQMRPGPAEPVADECTRARFERVLTTLCTNARGDVHLDLAELTSFDDTDPVDTAAVAALVRAAELLTAPARLVLHNPPAAVVRVLELTWPDHQARGIVFD
ncbi:hypothetical protein [Labedaea rhizosphaerae]|uniref:STAS domain-containing protein n=1 Tax=Labedaea rhizosphaerae TaxID=598644 RepID=A0A4R6SEJ7_LABRH|nr:hypothetical protein [Labedaea rhizosphaerae]TDQ00143.1 hypothetical protein EV186_1024 [Labedaea rhizosphaerae]